MAKNVNVTFFEVLRRAFFKKLIVDNHISQILDKVDESHSFIH